jgi:ATP-dependent Clp protease ATP-binding subunit ClpC
MFERYTEAARKAIFFARYEASQTGSEHIETEHLLLGILQTDEALALRMLKPPENIASIRKQIYENIPHRKKISTSVDLPLSDECKRILAYGSEEAERRHDRHIEPRHLLMGLLREEKCLGAKILLERGVPRALLEKTDAPPNPASPPDDFRDLTTAARNGELGPLIGRERETERAIQILSRRTRNNPVLVGESGVGKNAIVQGLAQRIADGATPPLLTDRTVLALDASALIGPRLDEELLDFAHRANAILYVHGLFDLAEKRSAWGVMQTIHAIELFLVSGGRQCIATGTPLGLRFTVERAASLARLFEVVPVLPPNDEQAIQMVSGARQQYEKFHGVVFADGSIETAVAASRWFLRHRNLPDRAFDLIDEAGARVALRRHIDPQKLQRLRKKPKPTPPGNIVTAEDVVETVAERAGVSVAAVKSLLQAKEVEQVERIVKELAVQIPGGGREWIESLAAHLAGCSAEEAERLAQAIRAVKAK